MAQHTHNRASKAQTPSPPLPNIDGATESPKKKITSHKPTQAHTSPHKHTSTSRKPAQAAPYFSASSAAPAPSSSGGILSSLVAPSARSVVAVSCASTPLAITTDSTARVVRMAAGRNTSLQKKKKKNKKEEKKEGERECKKKKKKRKFLKFCEKYIKKKKNKS
jgi:hypothetical protein